MHIDITPENLLIQLGYPTTPVMMEQMKEIMANTDGFDKFSKHLLSLNDELQHVGGYIAMSNSAKFLKIKTDKLGENDIEAFEEILNRWSEKYKVELKKVEGKNTFYIIGHK